MKRILPALLLFPVLFAGDAQACWGCKKKSSLAASSDQQVELVLSGIDSSKRWGVPETEVRTYFQIAYDRHFFLHGMEVSYERWKPTIRDTFYNWVDRQYNYSNWLQGKQYYDKESERFSIYAGIAKGTAHFNFVLNDYANARQSAAALGMEGWDGERGLFARALIAMGGRAKINQIYAGADADSPNFRTLDTPSHLSQLEKARWMDIGILAHDFLGFIPTSVLRVTPTAFDIFYGPDPTRIDPPLNAFARRALPPPPQNQPVQAATDQNGMNADDSDEEYHSEAENQLLLPQSNHGRLDAPQGLHLE